MTKPTFIAFLSHGSDGPKVFLRTLLYSTARRGQVVEGMFIRLVRDETQQTFNVWSYGETGHLVRGSGLYVGHDGVTHNHHFVLSADAKPFRFLPGAYELQVCVMLVHYRAPLLLARVPLHLTEEQARALVDAGEAVYFDWEPDAGKYHAYVRPRLGERASVYGGHRCAKQPRRPSDSHDAASRDVASGGCSSKCGRSPRRWLRCIRRRKLSRRGRRRGP
jgi:hypothetical protein